MTPENLHLNAGSQQLPVIDEADVRLRRIEVRQEALIQAVGKLAEMIGTTNALISEIAGWTDAALAKAAERSAAGG